MKYVNAQTVFPAALLTEMQKYVQGDLVYIPKSPANYIEWGTNTGAKDVTAHRNERIVNAYKTGASVLSLAEGYSLSEDTIKKIVYGKN